MNNSVATAKRQFGFGMLDIAVAMVVMTVLLGGAIYFYNLNHTSALSEKLYQEFEDLQRGVNKLYANKPGFEGLTEDILFDAGVIPDHMARPNNSTYEYRHSGKGGIQIQPVSGGCTRAPGCADAYGVKMFYLEEGVCRKLVMRDYDRVYQFHIGTTVYPSDADKLTMVNSCDDYSNGRQAFRVFFTK